MTNNEEKIWRIGTRGSELALVQAEMTEAALLAAYPDIRLERVVIKTTGDLRQDVRLADLSGTLGPDGEIIDKGVFTKELEIALLKDEIDVAVHSLKDVPTQLAKAFEITGVLERAPTEDVLLSCIDLAKGLDSMPPASVVGTSSVRRAKQLLHLRDDLKTAEIRGNVPTRIRKMIAGDFDAIILARAGLERLGHDPMSGTIVIDDVNVHAHVIDGELVRPAAGQGAVGFEIRKDDDAARDLIAGVNHAITWRQVRCEREFLRLLDAGCETPIGISTHTMGDEQRVDAVVFGDEALPEVAAVSGSESPEVQARQLFDSLKPLEL